MLLGPVENALAKSVAAYSGIPDVNLLQVCFIVFKDICFVLWVTLIVLCSWTTQFTISIIGPHRNIDGYFVKEN